MSDSDRGTRSKAGDVVSLLTILALCCLIVGVVTYSAGRQEEQQHQQAVAAGKRGNSHEQRPQQADRDHAGVPAFAERMISNPEPSNAQEREQRDLAAQENTAAWAFWVVVLSGAQFILSAVGLWALLRTIEQGREALQHAGDANELERGLQRPWLSIKLTSLGPFVWQDGLLFCQYSITITNSGTQPALAIRQAIMAAPAANDEFDRQSFIGTSAMYDAIRFAVAPNAERDRTFRGFIQTIGVQENGTFPDGTTPYLCVGVVYTGPRTDKLFVSTLHVLVDKNPFKHGEHDHIGTHMINEIME